ncbi:uncharacterized protein LTR77_009750 [Saxophila tyrrhenica]|uniref:Uncharacterized protein n=1 Tax=Saxophila tyrrhenica TaxID=1690608 RepID=A0AAV9NXA5_9PEZI|nr:hypothetical protein LTR77_009750 [Saxophila tyrrhenica]
MVNFLAATASLLAFTATTTALTNSRLFARQSDVSCRDSETDPFIANGFVPDAVDCINELAAKGGDDCTAGLATSFCLRGNTQITGIYTAAASGEDSAGTTTTTCQDVAQAAGRIMDFCSRGDGAVKGQTLAFANTQMLVDIRSIE